MSYDATLNDTIWENDGSACFNDGSPDCRERPAHSCSSILQAQVTSVARSSKHSFFSALREVVSEDFRFEKSPECSTLVKRDSVNGYKISTVTQSDIGGMSVEFAEDFLKQIHLEGRLLNKGFRGLHLWKRRYFVLNGNEMIYFDVL